MYIYIYEHEHVSTWTRFVSQTVEYFDILEASKTLVPTFKTKRL